MSHHATLAEALVAAQEEMPKVPKRGRNPHFKSEFVTLDDLLDAVRPILNKHGLAVVQLPAEATDGQPGLSTTILHTSGERIESRMPLTLAKQDMQGVGAAITYARRYMLAAALGIAEGTDDDGNQASARPAEKSRSDHRVEGPDEYPVPKTWAKVREAVEHCDNSAESWLIFEAYGRAASYHLYGETDGKKLSADQRKVMLQKSACAAAWLQDRANVPFDGEFVYFTVEAQRKAWAACLDGTLLEIPDYTAPDPEPSLDPDADRIAAEVFQNPELLRDV